MLRQHKFIENIENHSNIAFTIISCIVTTLCYWLAVAPGLVVVLYITVHLLYTHLMSHLSLPNFTPILCSGFAISLGDLLSTTLALLSCQACC